MGKTLNSRREGSNFLYSLYISGHGYSAINTAKSAIVSLSSISTSVLKPQLISRFMKGIFNDRPALPKYQHIWDINIVLNYLDSLPISSLDEKQLTLKTVMLFALLSGQRGQAIHVLKRSNVVITNDRLTCIIDFNAKDLYPS